MSDSPLYNITCAGTTFFSFWCIFTLYSPRLAHHLSSISSQGIMRTGRVGFHPPSLMRTRTAKYWPDTVFVGTCFVLSSICFSDVMANEEGFQIYLYHYDAREHSGISLVYDWVKGWKRFAKIFLCIMSGQLFIIWWICYFMDIYSRCLSLPYAYLISEHIFNQLTNSLIFHNLRNDLREIMCKPSF